MGAMHMFGRPLARSRWRQVDWSTSSIQTTPDLNAALTYTPDLGAILHDKQVCRLLLEFSTDHIQTCLCALLLAPFLQMLVTVRHEPQRRGNRAGCCLYIEYRVQPLPGMLTYLALPQTQAVLFNLTGMPSLAMVIQPNNPTANSIKNNPGHPHIALFMASASGSDVLIIVVSPSWFADGSAFYVYIPGEHRLG